MAIVLDTQIAGVARRIVLRNGHVATFGTDVWTDFSFPADSGLAARHFQLDCRNDRCELVVLEDRLDVFHNEIPVRSAQLRSGDRLSVGQTRIQVQFTGLESAWSAAAAPADTPKFTVTTAEACRGVELPPDVATIVAAHPVPPDCLDSLAAAGHIAAAVRVLAAVLPARAAIWWMFDFHRSAEPSMSPDRPPDLLKEIEAWIVEPTEEGRRRVETFVQEGDRQSPAVWLGWAIFWSGPSLAPATVDAVPPPGHLTGTGVATAALLLAARNPRTMATTLQQILQHGRDVLDGRRPWPAPS